MDPVSFALELDSGHLIELCGPGIKADAAQRVR
jgi:hypothetical protein